MDVPDIKLFKILVDLQDALRAGPPVTSAMRYEIGMLSSQATVEGHHTIALLLLLLFLGQAIDPLCQAEHVANTIDRAVELMPVDSVDARYLKLAAAIFRGFLPEG